MAKIYFTPDFAYLAGSDQKVIKSEKLAHGGATVIAVAKLRTFAKRNNIEVR